MGSDGLGRGDLARVVVEGLFSSLITPSLVTPAWEDTGGVETGKVPPGGAVGWSSSSAGRRVVRHASRLLTSEGHHGVVGRPRGTTRWRPCGRSATAMLPVPFLLGGWDGEHEAI